MGENEKPMADENFELNNSVNNGENDYTFVQERIVNKRQRFWRVMRKILVNVVIPVCVCVLIVHLYMEAVRRGEADRDEPVGVPPTFNGIHIDDGESTDIDNSDDSEEALVKLEERIKSMTVIISVVRKETVILEEETSSEEETGSKEETTSDKIQAQKTEEIENVTKYTGIVVAANGPLYILLPAASIEGYDAIYSQVGNKNMISTTVYNIDKTTGLAVLKIEASRITPEMAQSVTVATFAGNADMKEGDYVLYYGSVVGNSPMFFRGHISNNSNVVNCVDINYDLLITDIMYEQVVDGFLFNDKGKLVGISGIDYGELELPNVVAGAKAIDLRYIINNMLNDRNNIYMGIVAQDVSPEVEELAGGSMPEGIYVKNVIIDSPAYNAGMMAGDIIYGIGNDREDITMDKLRSCIEKLSKGDTINIKVKRKIGTVYNDYTLAVFLETID